MILILVHATHFLNQLHGSYFASVIMEMTRPGKFVIRKSAMLRYIFLFISSFDGENYGRVENSKYSHDVTLGLGNYCDKAFTTGCWSRGCTSKVETELLDMTTMQWSDGPDYPFAHFG